MTDLSESAGAIRALGLGQLVSRPEWGAVDFEAGKEDLEFVLSLAKDLDLLPTRSLPPTAAAGLAAVLRGVKGKLDEIDAFGIEQGDPATARDRLVGELRTATRDLQHEALICVPFLDYLNRRDSNPSSRLEEAVREAEVGAQDLQNALAERLAEAERVVDAIRSSAGEAGVASYAEQFQSEASSAQSRGRCWLGATVIAALAAVSFIVAYDSLAWPQQVESMSVLNGGSIGIDQGLCRAAVGRCHGLVWPPVPCLDAPADDQQASCA